MRITSERAQREAELTYRYKAGDLKARDELVSAYKGYVEWIAKKRTTIWGAENRLEDAIQEGNIGLMKAINRFEPEKGLLRNLSRYYIENEIDIYLMKHRKLVSAYLSSTSKKLTNPRIKKEIMAAQSEEEIKAAARKYGLNPKNIQVLVSSLGTDEVSLTGITPETRDIIECKHQKREGLGTTVEDEEMKMFKICNVRKALEAHFEANKSKAYEISYKIQEEIAEKRLLAEDPEKKTELGKRLGVSRETIRLSENKLKKSIRDYLEGMLTPLDLEALAEI